MSNYHPSLIKASQLFSENMFLETINSLADFINSDDPVIREQANALTGLSYFKIKDYDKAKYFYDIACTTSKNYIDWFNLSVSEAMNKNFIKSELAFSKMLSYLKKTKVNFKYKLIYYYIKTLLEVKEYKLALKWLEILKEAHMDWKTTDDHLLYMRGMPFFGDFLKAAVEILNHTDCNKKNWFNEVADCVDDDGKEAIKEINALFSVSRNSLFSKIKTFFKNHFIKY